MGNKRRHKWTLKHSFYATMGGFAIDTNDPAEDPYVSPSILHDLGIQKPASIIAANMQDTPRYRDLQFLLLPPCHPRRREVRVPPRHLGRIHRGQEQSRQARQGPRYRSGQLAYRSMHHALGRTLARYTPRTEHPGPRHLRPHSILLVVGEALGYPVAHALDRRGKTCLRRPGLADLSDELEGATRTRKRYLVS